MRELKYHEQKLLKKVDFFNWKKEHNLHEIQVMRRYHVQRREDYLKYNKIVGMITKIVSLVKKLDAKDPFRAMITESLLEKLYGGGVSTGSRGGDTRAPKEEWRAHAERWSGLGWTGG